MTLRFFGDDPVSGTPDSPDLLDRSTYAEHVVTLLHRVREQSRSGVLALIAPWGAGKSSVLAITARELRAATDDPWIVAELNPWAFSDMESLLHGFFATLREALPKSRRWNETRKTIGQLGLAISPLGKLGALAVGVDTSGMVAAGARLVGGNTSAAATQKRAEKALLNLEQPILMVLDDLDRLAPPELLLVMKLVRLVGRLPNVYYLLAYDEQTLKDVLRRTDLVGNNEQRASEYLEKIVQVRLDLPPLREQQAGVLVDAALNEILDRNHVELTAASTQRLQEAYQEVMRSVLATPRAINRFFGQVDAFYALVHGEVDFVDFMLMTWFRTTAPELYKGLQSRKADLTGTNLRRLIGGPRKPSDALAEWQAWLRNVGVAEDHVDAVLLTLSLMFLPVRSAKENFTYGSDSTNEIARRKGVGHVDYFDRYFTFGVPGEDIADSVVAQAMLELAEGSSGAALALLRARLITDNDRVIRKLLAQTGQPGGLPAEPLLALLADHYDALPDRGGIFVPDPHWSVDHLGRLLLPEVDAARLAATLERMARSDGGLTLVARIVVRLVEAQTDQEDAAQATGPSWLAEAKATTIGLLRRRLDEASAQPVGVAPDAVVALLMAWRRLSDDDDVQVWLNEPARLPDWSPLEVLAKLVPVGTVSGGGPLRPALGELDAGSMDMLYGLDRLLTELAMQIEEAPPSPGSFDVGPTPENRRAHVLNVLRVARDRRAAELPATTTPE